MQSVDKNRIQNNIGTGTDQDRCHTEAGKSLSGNKKIHTQGQHNKN